LRQELGRADTIATARFLFCGHADVKLAGASGTTSNTLGFTNAEGGVDLVQPDTLAKILGAYAPSKGGNLGLVFLNGCSSYQLGKAVHSAGIPFVICWRTSVHDEAACIFSVAFYRHLQEQLNATYEGAFEQAKQAVLEKTVPKQGDDRISIPKFTLENPAAGTKTASGAWAAGIPHLFSDSSFEHNPLDVGEGSGGGGGGGSSCLLRPIKKAKYGSPKADASEGEGVVAMGEVVHCKAENKKIAEEATTPQQAEDPPGPPAVFQSLSHECAGDLRKELQRLKAIIADKAYAAEEISSATVDVLKLVEKTLKEVCFVNGLANDDGGLAKEGKGKDGKVLKKTKCALGQYLRECKPLESHLSKQLMSKLIEGPMLIAEDGNWIQHEAGILYTSVKGMEYCRIGEALLSEVQPKKGSAASIGQWLVSVNPTLEQYAKAFHDDGYEDMDVLKEATKEDIEEMMDEAKMKKGHRRLLVNAMAALRQGKVEEAYEICGSSPASPAGAVYALEGSGGGGSSSVGHGATDMRMVGGKEQQLVLLLAEAQRKLLAAPNDANLQVEFDSYTRELAHLERGSSPLAGVTKKRERQDKNTDSTMWRNIVNMSVLSTHSGCFTLAKTGGEDWEEDAYCSSVEGISRRDGAKQCLEWEVGSAKYSCFVGFSHRHAWANTDVGGRIDFAFGTDGYDRAQVYERGHLNKIHRQSPCKSGDRLMVAVEGNKVSYHHNGTLLYTSTLEPTFPLYAHASFWSANSKVTALQLLVLPGSAATKPPKAIVSPSPNAITWQRKVNVTAVGRALEKTSGEVWADDAGCSSVEGISERGDMEQGVEWTIESTNKQYFIGLSHKDRDITYKSIEFALLIDADATLSIYEDGRMAAAADSVDYKVGDKLAIY
jgi:hypothetical protein